MPIKELRERTSSLVGRDVVIVGMVETVVAITEKSFDDWRLMSPCVGSYDLTLKDETDVLDILVKGRCVYENTWEPRASDCKRGEGVDEGGDLCPNLNPFERNPFIRAVAKKSASCPLSEGAYAPIGTNGSRFEADPSCRYSRIHFTGVLTAW